MAGAVTPACWLGAVAARLSRGKRHCCRHSCSTLLRDSSFLNTRSNQAVADSPDGNAFETVHVGCGATDDLGLERSSHRRLVTSMDALSTNRSDSSSIV